MSFNATEAATSVQNFHTSPSETIDDEMASNPTGDHYIFHSSPSTLSQLAATEVSLHCWRLETPFMYSDEKLFTHEFDSCSVLKVFLTKETKKTLDIFVKKTAFNLDKWISFHRKRIFLGFDRHDVILKCLNCVIFCQSTGNICYQKTAQKLLTIKDLISLDEKYRIACVYCFKNEIDRLWPLVPETTLNGTPSTEFPVMATNYWHNYKMNEDFMNDLLSGELYLESTKSEQVWNDFIVPMFQPTDMFVLTKAEYFWNVFVSPEQILMPTIIRSREMTADVYRFLLKMLNIDYQKNLLAKSGHKIISALAEEGIQLSYTLQVWQLVTNSSRFRADFEFFTLIQRLWQMAYDGSTEFPSSVAVFLNEIWSKAPEHLKLGLLNRHDLVASLFDELEGYNDDEITDMKTYKRDVKFIHDVLSRIKPDFRTVLWFKHWRKFIRLATLSNFIDMMKLCLNNQRNAVDKFKSFDMINFENLKNHFLSFIRAGFHQELNEYFTFCSSNQDLVQKIKQNMLQSIEQTPNFTQGFDLNRSIKFSKFIDSAFTSIQASTSKRYKREFIRNNLAVWLCFPLIKGYRLDEMRYLIDCFIFQDLDIAHIKHKFYERCKVTLSSASFVKFCANEWDAFLRWCAPTNHVDFEKTLALDSIFAALFTKVIRGRKLIEVLGPDEFYAKMKTGELSYPSYSTLDHFLWWYFRDAEKASFFKCKKIRDCYSEEIKTVLCEESCAIILEMLKWFCEDDTDEVARCLRFLNTHDWFVGKIDDVSLV